MGGPLRARWFDGQSSASRDVLVTLAPTGRGPTLSLARPDTGQALLALAPAHVHWPEPWSATTASRPITVDLQAHGSLQVDDGAAWHRAQEAAGHRATLAQRMQTHVPVLLAVFLVAAAGLAAFYRWGTPWAATQLTARIPLAWEISLSDRVVKDLDARHFKPSRLPPERQQALRARFAALSAQAASGQGPYPGYEPALRLDFRNGLGANALALPGGLVIVTDGLVETARKQDLPDDAIVGVLAHEIGHVAHRHTTRMVVEQAVLNVGLGLALGDVSTVFSSGASLLTGLAYQRGHEAQADCFGLGLMHRAGIATAPTGDLLLAIDAGAQRTTGWATLLSSHPGTAERAAALKAGRDDGCVAK